MKSIFGLDENVAAALSYLVGTFSGIAILIMERENKFVRFHALQSTLWFLLLMVAGWMLGIIDKLPVIGWVLGIIITPLLAVGVFVFIGSAVFLMYKAFGNETFKIPIIGDVVWAQINK